MFYWLWAGSSCSGPVAAGPRPAAGGDRRESVLSCGEPASVSQRHLCAGEIAAVGQTCGTICPAVMSGFPVDWCPPACTNPSSTSLSSALILLWRLYDGQRDGCGGARRPALNCSWGWHAMSPSAGTRNRHAGTAPTRPGRPRFAIGAPGPSSTFNRSASSLFIAQYLLTEGFEVARLTAR